MDPGLAVPESAEVGEFLEPVDDRPRFLRNDLAEPGEAAGRLGGRVERGTGSAAVEHPVICAVDRGMVKGMLAALYGDTSPEVTSSRPQGDTVCVRSF